MLLRTIGVVLAHPSSLLVGTGVVFVVLSVVAILPNSALIMKLALSGATVGELVLLVWSLYGSLLTNQSTFSAILTGLIALLSGINAALLYEYVRRKRGASALKSRVHISSVGGLVAGLFGIGCAACGSLLLSAILLQFGVVSLTLLPLHGVEFSLLGVLLLLYAIMRLGKEIESGNTCQT